MLSLGNSTVLLVLALLRLGRLKAGNRNINPFQVANKMAENRITTTASLLLWSVAPATDPWPRGSDVQNMRARVCVCVRACSFCMSIRLYCFALCISHGREKIIPSVFLSWYLHACMSFLEMSIV
jgi:hypothetical protein